MFPLIKEGQQLYRFSLGEMWVLRRDTKRKLSKAFEMNLYGRFLGVGGGWLILRECHEFAVRRCGEKVFKILIEDKLNEKMDIG